VSKILTQAELIYPADFNPTAPFTESKDSIYRGWGYRRKITTANLKVLPENF